MITKLHLDTIDISPHLKHVKNPTLYRANTPVRFIEFLTSEMLRVEMLGGETIIVEAGSVDSGLNCPEESLAEIARVTGLKYDRLVKAAREGRILARKSGKVWLSTVNAVEHVMG